MVAKKENQKTKAQAFKYLKIVWIGGIGLHKHGHETMAN
jgi:hypothetical protein